MTQNPQMYTLFIIFFQNIQNSDADFSLKEASVTLKGLKLLRITAAGKC